MNCKYCGGEFDAKEVERVYGLGLVERGFCSARCYTRDHVNEHATGQVAHEFARRLCDVLTVEQMLEVIDRNKAEPNQSVCHSHDFCDANVLMENAIHAVAPDLENKNQIWNAAVQDVTSI